MKKVILFGIAACVFPALCHSQSNTVQLPNGVIVHQAQGVEETPEPKAAEQNPVKTIQNWNLPECIDALAHTEMKLNEALEADRERYLASKAQIVQRINELKSGK